MSLDLDLAQFHDHLNQTNMSVEDTDSQDIDMNSNHRGNGPNQAEKRAHHNALERRRRDHIKGSFSDLRDVIPSLKGEKASRAHVLKAATDFIRTMKTKNQQHRETIDNLKKQNALIDLQTRLLERVKRTGQYTRQIHQQNESLLKIDPDFTSSIAATQNLLTNENHCSNSS